MDLVKRGQVNEADVTEKSLQQGVGAGGAVPAGPQRVGDADWTGMSDLPPLPTLPLGRYRHYKGGEYQVLGVVRHSETREPLVLYRPLYGDSGDWVRPYAMFVGTVTVDGVTRPRFRRLTP